MGSSEKEQVFFTQLVMMFHAAAIQQMGKIKNPLTDEIERDLKQAQISIDMLDMIQQKTKGNLTQDEARFLSSILQELKLNYVDEVNKEKQSASQQSEKKETP